MVAPAPQTFDAVRDGLVDLSYVTASYTPARHILPLMAELPGAGETAEINSVAYSRIHWKHFHKVGEYKGGPAPRGSPPVRLPGAKTEGVHLVVPDAAGAGVSISGRSPRLPPLKVRARSVGAA